MVSAMQGRLRRRALQLAAVVVIAGVAWIVLWGTAHPRAGWDSLIYHRLALEYAGAPNEEQRAVSLTLFRRYASDTAIGLVESGMARGGTPWEAMESPGRESWIEIYRSRPVYPYLVALLYPILALWAPLAMSALAVLIFTLAVLWPVSRLHGLAAAAIALVLALANPAFAPWLVGLQTDGIAIALWTMALGAAGVYLVSGSALWLAGVFLSALVLVFARPLGSFLPLAFFLPAVVAAFLRGPWVRFVLLAAATSIPVILFGLWSAVMGFPGIEEQFQDLPTRHFRLPPVENPFTWTFEVAWAQLTRSAPIWVSQPFVALGLMLGLGGLLLARSWALAPFVAAAAFAVPLSYFVHPQISEMPRTMAPMWVSLHLGVAIVAVHGLELLQAFEAARAARTSP